MKVTKTASIAMLFIAMLCQTLCAQSPPANDANKWHITVFTAKDCTYCEDLRRDFETPHLAPWKQFAHVNFIDINQASQENRKVAFSVSPEGGVPIILCYPPKNDPTYPYYLVFRQSGYDGDELKLSRAIYKNVSEFQRVMAEDPKIETGDIRAAMEATTGRCIGCRLFHRRPWCPQPDNDDEPDVDVDVDVAPRPLPVIPDITPDTIRPKPDPDEGGEMSTDIPDYPLVTIIYDPQGFDEESRIDLLKEVARKIIEPYNFSSPKAQVVELGSERAKAFPTRMGDAPAIFVTDRGKILAAISRPTISLLTSSLDTDDPPPTDVSPAQYQSIIDAVVKALTGHPSLKGDPGPPGEVNEASVVDKLIEKVKGDQGLQDSLRGETPVVDTAAIEKVLFDKLLAELSGKIPPIPEPPTKDRRVVVVADQEADYWPRLSSEVKAAQGYYSNLTVAPPPEFSVPLPQLVVYEGGVPVRRTVGLRDVSSDLAQISRGSFPLDEPSR